MLSRKAPEAAMPVTSVNVHNANDFVLTDKYDNARYTFSPGRTVSIPVAVAKHIFGWHERAPDAINFLYMAERLGWDRTDVWPQAYQWLKRFTIGPAETEPVPTRPVPVRAARPLASAAEALEPAPRPPPSPKPGPGPRPKPGALERRRELTRLRVARYRARLKERQAAAAAAEGRCNAY
jgi:hypothetical protein